jgi:DNA polymerase/3'-5' exonuclease PolX
MSAPTAKTKHPAEAAKRVARALCEHLKLCCEINPAEQRPFLVVAGSLRRRKAEVGDVEILCVPRIGQVPDGLFTKQGSLVDQRLEELLERGILAKRKNCNGAVTWGVKNKLAVHVESGMPVDLFIATAASWYNYLVCRTGGKDSNTAIATAAQKRGLKWHPYDEGFEVIDAVRASTVLNRELRPRQMLRVMSEADVFAFAGLNYLEPHDRS